MKMILLLLILTSSAAAFEVKATQTKYEAEENHSVTLEWTFTFKPGSSLNQLSVYCEHLTEHKSSVLYDVSAGEEEPDAVGEGFSGRVQSDRDALSSGRIRLHVSRLKTEDSGTYVCDVSTSSGSGSSSCDLRVSAADDQTHTDRLRPEPGPEPEPALRPEPGRWRRHHYVLIAVALGFLLLILMVPVYLSEKKEKDNISDTFLI